MKEHEYIVICGLNRSYIGRVLTGIASLISAMLIYVLLKLVDIAKYFDINANLPPSLLSLISAGGIYAFLYAWFNSKLWSWPLVSKYIKVPNLSGQWSVEGRTCSGEGFEWKGKMIIIQSWDKVRIRLQTITSNSDSITASIIYEDGIGYRLIYNYQNTPKLNEEKKMELHTGYAEIDFNHDLLSGVGEYFNGRGRNTFGTMKITRD